MDFEKSITLFEIKKNIGYLIIYQTIFFKHLLITFR